MIWLLLLCCQFPLGEDRTISLFVESYPKALTLAQFYACLDDSCRNFEGACDVRFKRTPFKDEAQVVIRCCELDGKGKDWAQTHIVENRFWQVRFPPEVYLDKDEDWEFDSCRRVVAHELGHCLGLDHMGDGMMSSLPNRVWKINEQEAKRLAGLYGFPKYVTLYGPPKRLVARVR